MKKKRLLIANACVLLVILFTVTVYGKTNDQERQIKELITLRIEIMQDYYHHDETYDTTVKKLNTVECDSLLSDDYTNLKQFSRTEVDYIKDFKMNIEDVKKSSHGIVNGTAEIQWKMEGVKGIYNVNANYYFVAEKHNGRLKLTRFKKL